MGRFKTVNKKFNEKNKKEESLKILVVNSCQRIVKLCLIVTTESYLGTWITGIRNVKMRKEFIKHEL